MPNNRDGNTKTARRLLPALAFIEPRQAQSRELARALRRQEALRRALQAEADRIREHLASLRRALSDANVAQESFWAEIVKQLPTAHPIAGPQQALGTTIGDPDQCGIVLGGEPGEEEETGRMYETRAREQVYGCLWE